MANTWRKLLHFCLLLVFFMLVGYWSVPIPATHAVINTIGPLDSCGLIRVTLNENPSCPVGTKVANYTTTIHLQTNNFVGHTVSYILYNNFCPGGNVNGCASNAQNQQGSIWVDTPNPGTLTISRSPVYGSMCGTYQDDFVITSIDGNKNCHFGDPNSTINGSSAPGGAGICQTGSTCQYRNLGTCAGLPASQSLCTDAPCGQAIAQNYPHLEYRGIGACPQNCCTINPTPTPTPTNTPTPTPTPIPRYTITGNVFVDANKDRLLDNGETNYPGQIGITATGGTVTSNNGSFTISNLLAGSYLVSYTSLPPGYFMVYPRNATPPSFLVTVGPGCQVDTTTGAKCTNNNITNLNFAISNAQPWMQLIDFDGRIDSGFQTTIPSNPDPQCGGYASVQDTQSNTPGVVYSGDTSPDFGQGQASSKNWVIGGALYPETVAPTVSLRTSYAFLLNTARKAGIPLMDISTLPTCTDLSNCTLPANLPNGIYQASSSLTLNGFTFPAGKNYIFLVNGDLTVMGNIVVPTGSTALFSTAGNIFIDKSVKAAADSCPVPQGQLQGLFSADKSFTVQGINDCSVGKDTMLNIEGTVVVNAARNGGSFVNKRDLCADNLSFPSVTMKPRLDFLFNAPTMLLQQQTFSTEQAP